MLALSTPPPHHPQQMASKGRIQKSRSPGPRKTSVDSTASSTSSKRNSRHQIDFQFVAAGPEPRGHDRRSSSFEPTFVQYTGPANERGSSPTTPTFQFVNTSSTSRTVGLAERTLARSHVARTASRGPAGELYRKKLSRAVSPAPVPSPQTPTFVRSPGSQSPPPATAPQPMPEELAPVTDFLLGGVAAVYYPQEDWLQFNPVREIWLPTAMRDETMFYALMYMTASWGSVSRGFSSADQAVTLLQPAFEQIRQNIGCGLSLSHGTLASVAFLAAQEIMLKQADHWQIHMHGLMSMVKSRGGLDQLDDWLRILICRNDVEGAATFNMAPNFERMTRTHTPVYAAAGSTSPSVDAGFITSLQTAEISADLITQVASIRRFSHAISEATRTGMRLSPYGFEEDLILLLHDLLTYTPADSDDEVVRVAALIYLEGISHGLPLAMDFSTEPLLYRFVTALQNASADMPRELRVWALSITLLSSRGLTSTVRDWLLLELRRHADQVQDMGAWRACMHSALWIDVLHGQHLDALYWEVFV